MSSVSADLSFPRKTKSYRGCKACKHARRRCTEEKPKCSFCVKYGKDCEYDTDSLFRIQKIRKSSAKGTATTSVSRPLKIATHPAATSPTTSILSRTSTSTLSKSRSPRDFSPTQQIQTPTDTNRQDPFADLFSSSSENDDQDHNPTKPSPNSTTLSTFLTSSSTATSTSPLLSPTSFEDHNTNRDTESYFTFFLSELSKCFPYVNLFPWTAATLFSSSNHNPALRQSVLAVAALINKSQGQQEALDHLQRALQLIRDRISSVEVDEGIAISSFLLSHFSMMLGDCVTAKKHLKGMLVVLQRLDHYHVGGGGRGGESRDGLGGGGREGVPNPLRMDELTMLIWRMAIRIDFISSIASGKPPILPDLPDEEEGDHLEWIKKYADTNFSPDNADWAETWFAVDALMHRTCHIASVVTDLRTRPGSQTDKKILSLISKLKSLHEEWRERKVISKAFNMERMNDLLLDVQIGSAGWEDVISPLSDSVTTVTTSPQILAPTQILQSPHPHPHPHPQQPSPNPPPHLNPAAHPSTRFLTYSPIRIFDPFFASRLSNWRATQLLISLIQDPMWGLYNGTRFVCAVDLCRTHAALGEERNFLGAEKAVGLYLAGVVFGGPHMYESESEWILEQLEEIKEFYPIATTLSMNLKRVWSLKGNYWDAIRRVVEEQGE